jgi:hypothetical protein
LQLFLEKNNYSKSMMREIKTHHPCGSSGSCKPASEKQSYGKTSLFDRKISRQITENGIIKLALQW